MREEKCGWILLRYINGKISDAIYYVILTKCNFMLPKKRNNMRRLTMGYC